MEKEKSILKWKFLIILMMFLAISQLIEPPVLAAKPIKLIMDGKDITSLSSPVIEKGRTLVPIRFIVEELGAKVDWNGKDRTVKIEKDNSTIVLRINSHLVSFQDKDKRYNLIDVAPKLINSRTFVPLRFVSNALGIGIDWDEANRTINIDSNEVSAITPFFDVKISSLEPGQAITGKTDLQITLSEIENGKEIKYLLLDPDTAQGFVIARGNELDGKYTWIPDLNEKGERVLVAAIYDENGRFIAGDSIPVNVKVNPRVSLTGIAEDQIIDETVSLGTDASFIASYVKYEITNLDNDKKIITEEQDPQGKYNWTPMISDNGNYSFKVIAYDSNGKDYPSETINAKVDIIPRLGLKGVSFGQTIDRPVDLLASRNFHVSETEYVLIDPNTGEEEVLAKMGYGNYRWFPSPEYKGTKEVLVRVKDTKGKTYESERISINLLGTPKLLLDGVGPKQVLTEPVKLKAISNVSLDNVNYYLINSTTGTKKLIASNQNPQVEYTYIPTEKDAGYWNIQVEGEYKGNKIKSEDIPIRIYFGKTYKSSPIIEKDKYLGLASKLAKNSWEKTGMSAALQTAQSILETGWGQGVPVDKYSGKISYNLFGIKGEGPKGSVISNTWEEYNGKVFYVDAEFRAYNNVEESWTDHKNFLLNRDRYEPFREVMHNSTQGAWALKRTGYATDSKYALKLMQIIKQHNLQELDKTGI